MPKPFRLTDSELTDILHLATPIPVSMRDAYLTAIARELKDREPGVSVIYRIASELQARFMVAVPRVPRVPARWARKDSGIRADVDEPA
jgi:hypothetical protein